MVSLITIFVSFAASLVFLCVLVGIKIVYVRMIYIRIHISVFDVSWPILVLMDDRLMLSYFFMWQFLSTWVNFLTHSCMFVHMHLWCLWLLLVITLLRLLLLVPTSLIIITGSLYPHLGISDNYILIAAAIQYLLVQQQLRIVILVALGLAFW